MTSLLEFVVLSNLIKNSFTFIVIYLSMSLPYRPFITEAARQMDNG